MEWTDSFKPASITPSTTGEVEMSQGKAKSIYFNGRVSTCLLLSSSRYRVFVASPLAYGDKEIR